MTLTMINTFDALGVEPDLVKALAETGVTQPFPIQAATIADALAGRDVCGKARTGSGKTLAFGVPLVQRATPAEVQRPTALVLVPTRELAAQVCDVLVPLGKARKVRVAAVYGGTPYHKQVNRLKKGVEVAVATPGRLMDLYEQGDVHLDGIDYVVVDEADRMNDMGFRPQVEWLLRKCVKPHQTLLFSATLDRQVDSLVQRFMKDPVVHEVGEEPTVESMTHRFISVHELDKIKLTATVAESHDRALIFVRTKRGADKLQRRLAKEGVQAEAIHGDRSQAQRERALARFAKGNLHVLVATDVAARGIDVDGIDLVLHYDPPEDHKAYLHRSGRTARAGNEGLVVTLALWNQRVEMERLQKLLGLSHLPVVEMLSNDPRLRELASWDPAAEDVA
jgi:superfamily II DNA/RNA helicase